MKAWFLRWLHHDDYELTATLLIACFFYLHHLLLNNCGILDLPPFQATDSGKIQCSKSCCCFLFSMETNYQESSAFVSHNSHGLRTRKGREKERMVGKRK
uniref:Uncharacterized protein n=1 Tax=Manihot esculenta TaxID=3983 RepID=A0A2C9WFB4_MANES